MNIPIWIFLLGLFVGLGTTSAQSDESSEERKKDSGLRTFLKKQRKSSASSDESMTESDLAKSLLSSFREKLAALPGQNDCGYSGAKTGRIVGGEPAKLGAWPWVVALGQELGPGTYAFFCGGTLISSKYVISAAHCVASMNGDTSGLFARIGDLDLNDEENDGAQPVTIAVKSYYTPEKYSGVFYGRDISLLVLDSEVKFTDLIRPICLPLDDVFHKKDFEGFMPFVAGWGLMGEKGHQPTLLQQVQLPIIGWSDCKGLVRAVTLSEDSFCTIAAGKDACQGDSGGAVMLPYETKYYLYGIVSYGEGCARPDNPGVYNRVTTHLNWIAGLVD